jgi:hypothetical protein
MPWLIADGLLCTTVGYDVFFPYSSNCGSWTKMKFCGEPCSYFSITLVLDALDLGNSTFIEHVRPAV